MKESIITIMLTVFSLILVGIACVGIFFDDKNAPVISLEGQNTLIYTEGEDYDVLLKNMSAEDEEDGDVTESLRVSDIYVIDDDKALVVYVAKDEANNIAKLKREVRYKAKGGTGTITEELEQTEEGTPGEQEAETSRVTTPQTATTVQEPQDENLDGPTVTMIQNEATLKVGETFNVLRYIQSAVDADGTSLSRYIHVEGAYDMSQPGVYSIRVYASSPSGEISNIETFTLTVEP